MADKNRSDAFENSEELLYTHHLADTDNTVRMRTLRSLKKFLGNKSQKKGFTYDELLKIWKGLYYCMYMADKHLVQESLAEDISHLIHFVSTNPQKILFFKVAMDTFAREWNGIDKFRMDKFLMLITRVFRQCLLFLLKIEWNREEVKEVCEILGTSVIPPFDETHSKPIGLKLHMSDILIEELAKVGRRSLPDRVLISFIYPFIKVFAVSSKGILVEAIEDRILNELIRQSEAGLEHQDDLTFNELEIVKETGEDDQEEEEEIEDDDENFVMDPRAGGIDAYIPPLRPDYSAISDALMAVGKIKQISECKRSHIFRCAKKFSNLTIGIYPFEMNCAIDKPTNRKKEIRAAVTRIMKNLDGSKRSKLKSTVKEEVIPLKSPSGKNKKLNKKKELRNKKKKMNLNTGVNKKKDKKLMAKKLLRRRLKTKKILDRKLQTVDSYLWTDESKAYNSQGSTGSRVLNSQGNTGSNVPASSSAAAHSDTNCIIKTTDLTAGSGERKVKRVVSKSTDCNKIFKGKNRKAKTIGKEPSKRKCKSLSTEQSLPNSVEIKEIGREKSYNKTYEKPPQKKKRSQSLQSSETDTISDTDKGNSESRPLLGKQPIRKEENNVEKTANTKKSRSGKGEKSKKQIQTGVPAKETYDWDGILKETETEIFIPRKKFAKKMKKITNKRNLIVKTPKVNTKGRVLKIDLGNNQEHDLKDYTEILKTSPGIPYSAHKKPLNSVLKACTPLT